ncbi:MAG: prephenate dehydrogenase/arogenate dehydrogenase family protein [Caldilineae bacterium]|nr:MAG: prephenate dehydrogenase/arogenate dehydrogenase family protein [Caldilineae bacterium]
MSQITIIGLGLIGTSLGLALKREEHDYIIVGHDKDSKAVQRARRMGAIDKSHWNLIAACEHADLILLAIPTAGIAPTLEAICDDLKPGCLIMDTAAIKRPVMKAAEVLPDNVHFVGGNPILARGAGLSADDASADLFEGASWALCAAPTTAPDAIRVSADLVAAVGAQPLFLDADEHDGLVAAVDGLPTILAAALMRATAQSPAWREIRRLAGGQYESLTYLPDFEPADLTAAVQANSVNIIHWLDTLIGELGAWKEALQSENGDALNQGFEKAIDARAQWLKKRARGDWEERDRPEDAPSFWRSLFGFRAPPSGKK